MRNFHLPLPQDLYDKLKIYSQKQNLPATVIARSAIEEWINKIERVLICQEIKAYAEANSSSEVDIDNDLEETSLEHLQPME